MAPSQRSSLAMVSHRQTSLIMTINLLLSIVSSPSLSPLCYHHCCRAIYHRTAIHGEHTVMTPFMLRRSVVCHCRSRCLQGSLVLLNFPSLICNFCVLVLVVLSACLLFATLNKMTIYNLQ